MNEGHVCGFMLSLECSVMKIPQDHLCQKHEQQKESNNLMSRVEFFGLCVC